MTINDKLQFGCYYVDRIYENGTNERVLLKPLSQIEYADGWRCNLPKLSKSNNLYNWNVSLAQLPPHLWKYCYYDYENNNYKKIKNNIYHYNISSTDYDKEMFELYNLLNQINPNLERVNELYHLLKNNDITGWLLIKAHKLIFS